MQPFTLVTDFTNSSNREQINIYLASSPNAIVESVTYSPPHVGGHTWRFYNIIPSKNYLYKWLQIDSSGNPILQYGSQYFTVPSSGSFAIKSPVELVADTSPNVHSGVNVITLDGSNGSEDIRGWDITLEKTGFDTQFKVLVPDYALDTVLGTITFNNVGGVPYQIAVGEKYFLQYVPKILGSAPVVVQGAFTGIKYIDNNYTILAGDFGQNLLQVDSSLAYLYLDLPDITTVPENKELIIKTGNGGHKNVTLRSNNANAIDWLEGNRTEVYLGVRESLKVYRQNNNGVNTWQIIDADGNFKFVGLITNEFTPVGNVFNRVLANGQILGITEHARLFFDYVLQLTSDEVVPYASWPGTNNINKTKFSLPNLIGQFHVPDLSLLYPRTTDATIAPGTFVDHQLLIHKHEGTTGQLPTPVFGSGLPRVLRTIGKYLGIQTNAYTDWTSTPIGIDGSTIQTGSENLVKSYMTRNYILV